MAVDGIIGIKLGMTQIFAEDGTTIPVAKSQMDSLRISKPDDFDKAAAMVTNDQYAAAIPLLRSTARSTLGLVWWSRVPRPNPIFSATSATVTP